MMKNIKLVQLTGLVVLFFIAMMSCNQESAKSNKDASKIIYKVEQAYEDAYNKKDATAVSMLYAENGSELPPGADMITGRENIKKLLQNNLAQGATNLQIDPISFEIKGDLGYQVGKFQIDVPTKEGKIMTVKGKYVSIVTKTTKGNWLIKYHIFNYDPVPAPPTAPATNDSK